MIKESQIIHENGIFWVFKEKGLFFVMKNVGTHSEQVANTAWNDESIAVAYCNYQARRDENTYKDKQNCRHCKTCGRIRAKEYQRKKTALAKARGES